MAFVYRHKHSLARFVCFAVRQLAGYPYSISTFARLAARPCVWSECAIIIGCVYVPCCWISFLSHSFPPFFRMSFYISSHYDFVAIFASRAAFGLHTNKNTLTLFSCLRMKEQHKAMSTEFLVSHTFRWSSCHKWQGALERLANSCFLLWRCRRRRWFRDFDSILTRVGDSFKIKLTSNEGQTFPEEKIICVS